MRPLLYPGSSVVRRVAACRALSCASAKQQARKQASELASYTMNGDERLTAALTLSDGCFTQCGRADIVMVPEVVSFGILTAVVP